MKKILMILLTVLILSGNSCEMPDVPETATCTADGWRVDFETGDIITNDETGAAILCDFS